MAALALLFYCMWTSDLACDLFGKADDAFPPALKRFLAFLSSYRVQTVFWWQVWFWRLVEVGFSILMVALPIGGLLPINHPDAIGGAIFAATLLAEAAWLIFLASQPRRAGPRNRSA